jgi:hypothetical protein
MAIRKPGSRFTDRNTMRKMYAEGYSVAQIALKLSIKDEHVVYCLEEWDEASEKARDQFKISEAARMKREREALMLPAEVNAANLRAEMEMKVRAEIAAEKKPAPVVPIAEVPDAEAPAAEPTKTRRKRKTA